MSQKTLCYSVSSVVHRKVTLFPFPSNTVNVKIT